MPVDIKDIVKKVNRVAAKRNYKKEYANYQGKPDQIKKRAKRVMARRALEKAGIAKKGDGKDVDHKKHLSKGGTNSRKNLRMRSVKSNRSDNGHRKGEKQNRKK